VGLPEAKSQQGRTFDEACWIHICTCKESKKKLESNENRRPKVVYRRVLRLCGEGFDMQNMTRIPLIMVFHISILGGLQLCLGG